jgi:hypothetical protein
MNQEMAGVDFSGLVLGFSSAALYYLGEVPVEGKTVPERNLPLAKQNIDIIHMLSEKTRNNLSKDEEKLLNQVLADLRMKYVDASKTPNRK